MAKRALDLLLAGLGLVVLSPLLAAIALAIRLDSPGPVFYRQERVGRGGARFRIHKFRSMRHEPQGNGPQLTVGGDARITRVGAVLRRTKLDELAQLVDVLQGTMSLVGPRPEVPRYVELYTPEQRRVLDLLPGITDLASIEYYDEAEVLATSPDPDRAYVEEIMPEKIRLNLEYARGASVWTDLRVVLGTLLRLTPRARR